MFPGVCQVRVKLPGAIRAETMGEFGIIMSFDIFLDLLPVSVILADLLAVGANWQKSSQSPRFSCELLKLYPYAREQKDEGRKIDKSDRCIPIGYKWAGENRVLGCLHPEPDPCAYERTDEPRTGAKIPSYDPEGKKIEHAETDFPLG